MTHPELQAARLMLARLGVTPEQLLATPTGGPVPTFVEYLPRVAEAVSEATRRVYGSYWERILHAWGDRPIDAPTPLEIAQLVERTRENAVVRRNSRGGASAAEHMLGALRCMYRHAVADGHLRDRDNPAAKVPKPRRLASARGAIPDAALAEINHVAATTGNDPELDSLLMRAHQETACRRGGMLAARRDGLDTVQCLLRLHEKGGTVRWQPISPSLTRRLAAHHTERSDGTHPKLLCYRNGRPISARRYDHLWTRIGSHLPWVQTQMITTHWLRHTTLRWVERHFGYAVARAYAGHAHTNGNVGATLTYVRADIHEVAAALATLTGEPHPLAPNSAEHDPSPAIGAIGGVAA